MGKKKGQDKGHSKKDDKHRSKGGGFGDGGSHERHQQAGHSQPQPGPSGDSGQSHKQQQQQQQQGAWGAKRHWDSPEHRSRPTSKPAPQKGAWEGQQYMREQPPPPPPAEEPTPPPPPPGQQEASQLQPAWGSQQSLQWETPQYQIPPPGMQMPAQQVQQGAWGSQTLQWGPPQPPAGQQQLPPQQQPQGAWGSQTLQWGPPQPPAGQQQLPPQQPQGAWAGQQFQLGVPQSSAGQQQLPPQQPQGVWAGQQFQRGPPQPSAGQQQPTQQPQGVWAGQQFQRGPPQPPAGQQQPPQQPQGAWAGQKFQRKGPKQQHGDKKTGQPQKESSQPPSWPSSSQEGEQMESSEQSSQLVERQPRELAALFQESSFAFAERIHAPVKSGTPIRVKTNFFRLIIHNPHITVYHYNVVMEPDKPKFLLRTVWNKFVSTNLNNRWSAFVERNAFSKGPLINGKTCTATVTVFNPDTNREKEFTVTIEEVRHVSFASLMNYAERIAKDKSMKVLPEAELSVLEIILKEWAANNCVVSGRSAFFSSSVDKSFCKLSDKLLMRTGYFQAVCLGSVPYLNFDISHKAFYQSSPVLNIYECFKNRYNNSVDEEEFNRFMRSVKVEYELPHCPESRKVFRVNKLVGNARTQTFEKENHTMTVASYFEREKNIRLRYPELPLLWVGPTQKSVYVPMEFCRIMPDQVFRGLTNQWEKREMVKSSTNNATVSCRKIMEMFQKANLNGQPLMKEFGLKVANEMEVVTARVLAAPELKTSRSVTVRDGAWKIRDFLEPVTLNRWCILNADKQVRRENLMVLQNLIKSKGNQLNMVVTDPIRETIHVGGTTAELKKVFSQLKNMDMVFVIISEAKGLYSRVKTICETQEGVLTQCVRSRTIAQDQMKLGTTVENILLKVNAKLGGKNVSLNHNSIPACLSGYVMVVGADVTHPSPGVRIPSVAAVAVSCDPAAFKYGMTIRVQPKGEMIVDLKEIMSIQLQKFYELRKRYPEKIIFFRDGVSEGELPKVFKSELMAIKGACERFCEPKITFIVVQKRHHAKFFPTRKEDEQGKNFNVPVGTCVDSNIVHPRDLDFYLVSHASILGTARPTRYRLLHDDSKITDDELERLTFYLCHLFARCNRSVSYPSPTYNAHLAAFRARAYLEGLNITSDQDIPSIQRKLTDNISNISPMFFV